MENDLQLMYQQRKTKLIQDLRQQYFPISSKLEKEIDDQELKNNTEQSRCEQLDMEIQKTDKCITKFVQHISFLQTQDKIANKKSCIFKAWADLANGKDFITNVSNRIYLQHPLERIMFKRWIRRFKVVRQKHLITFIRTNCKNKIMQKELEMEQRISALQTELTAVKKLLAENKKHHIEMEQRLQRAFMRGIVNLNLEAIEVFGEIPQLDIHEKSGCSDGDTENDFTSETTPKISIIKH